MYAELIAARVRKEHSIKSAATYGSCSRSEWKSSSDLDIRLIRQPGLVNGVWACIFVLTERTRALFNKYPLDIYVLDDIDNLDRLRSDEIPIIISDENGLLNEFYQSNLNEENPTHNIL